MKTSTPRTRPRASGPAPPLAEAAILLRSPKTTRTRAVSATELGRIYDLYAADLAKYARRWGCSREDAEDFTQEFFLRLERKDSLASFDRAKGSFRSFLLTLFQRFLVNQWHRLHALRRGGIAVALPLVGAGEADKALIDWRTPEKIAHLHSARLLLERALEALRTDLARQGKAQLFDALLPHLLHSSPDASCARSARQIGLSDAATRMTVSRYRGRLRVLIRRQLAGNGSGNGNGHDQIRELLEMFEK